VSGPAQFAGVTLLLVIAACGDTAPPLEDPAAEPTTATAPNFRYNREFIFVSLRDEEPLVVPFSFASVESGEEYERTARAWLARGEIWDRFIEESWFSPQAGGVWRVVPRGNLRVNAGGPTEIETLRFESGERRLRLDLPELLTEWKGGPESRFRLLSGLLTLGAESFPGPVFEVLRVERTLDDGWPPGIDFDALFLASGDSVQLVVAETVGDEAAEPPQFAWTRTPLEERTWESAEITWLEVRAFEEARRDVPVRWSFRIPDGDIRGEVDAVGQDALLGPEREGRRAIEIRFTVTGWVEFGSERVDLAGMIRHTQQ
jgi:hypothetical protein